MNRRILLICFILYLFIPGLPDPASGTVDSIRVLIADNPLECLSLESIFVDGENYIFIDGRNSRGRAKFINPDGTITRSVVSTIPLPDAASLPPDIPASPWGLDRMIPSTEYLWGIPASWAGAIAEKFDRETGTLLERLPDPGLKVKGIALGPEGRTWAVGNRILLNLGVGSPEALNLSTTIGHIDSAIGHPFGFIIFSQPEIFLIETTGIIRWRRSFEGVIDNFLSPIDLAAGPDGTIAICAMTCDLSIQEDYDEYFRLRNEAMSRDDEEVLFAIEDALRSNLGIGFILMILEPDGAITDVIDLSAPPVSCAVDNLGRAHVMSYGPDGWIVSIVDPRLEQGFTVLEIPYGSPALISPHRLAIGSDGNLYWDDIIPGDTTESWGIFRFNPSSTGDMFSLGDSEVTPSLVYTEPMEDFIRQATALAVDSENNIWVGCQDIPFSLLEEDIPLEFLESDSPYISSVLTIDSDGNVSGLLDPSQITGTTGFPIDFLSLGDSVIATFSGSELPSPTGQISGNWTWTPSTVLNFNVPIGQARIGEVSGNLIGWFLYQEDNYLETRWFDLGPDLGRAQEIIKLSTLGCRYIASDPAGNMLWVTIDDGEIFALDATTFIVTGIWNNRLDSNAPGHPIDYGVNLPDGLAILDSEHRAILLVKRDAFDTPYYVSQADVDEAIGLIRSGLWTWKNTYGIYPSPSSGLLDDILDYNEREVVRRAFLGGRIYQYKPTETGYTFVAWASITDHPVMVCDQSGTQVIN